MSMDRLLFNFTSSPGNVEFLLAQTSLGGYFGWLRSYHSAHDIEILDGGRYVLKAIVHRLGLDENE